MLKIYLKRADNLLRTAEILANRGHYSAAAFTLQHYSKAMDSALAIAALQ